MKAEDIKKVQELVEEIKQEMSDSKQKEIQIRGMIQQAEEEKNVEKKSELVKDIYDYNLGKTGVVDKKKLIQEKSEALAQSLIDRAEHLSDEEEK